MKILFSGNIGNNQDGSMIVIAILLIALLTIVGVASMDDAVVENRIAVNAQLKKIALYHADSGTSALVPKLLRTWLVDGQNGDIGTLQVATDDEGASRLTSVFDQVKYGTAYDGGLPDIGYQFTEGEMASDVERLYFRAIRGGQGVEFASGAGVRGSAGAAFEMGFRITTEGTGLRGATSTVLADYRYVPGIAGGL